LSFLSLLRQQSQLKSPQRSQLLQHLLLNPLQSLLKNQLLLLQLNQQQSLQQLLLQMLQTVLLLDNLIEIKHQLQNHTLAVLKHWKIIM